MEVSTGGGIGIVDNKIKNYAKSIKIKDSLNNIISAGNIFTFNSSTEKSILIPNNINANSAGLEQITNNLARRYDSIQNELVEVPTGEPYDENSLFNSIIDKEKMKSGNNWTSYEGRAKRTIIDNNVVIMVDNEGNAPYVIQRDNSLPNEGRQGIVIATGDIEVKDDFTGLILSGSEISLRSGVRVTGADNVVEAILEKNHSEVNQYFRGNIMKRYMNSEADVDYKNIDISDLIVFHNWVKNE